eukprot:SAG31_NODE_1753_length_7350_cov_1.885395_2_plen_86_part_00
MRLLDVDLQVALRDVALAELDDIAASGSPRAGWTDVLVADGAHFQYGGVGKFIPVNRKKTMRLAVATAIMNPVVMHASDSAGAFT